MMQLCNAAFLLLAASIAWYEVLAPDTKVEESFNMQAMHDFLFIDSVDQFDHLEYPGVVPRTFLPSLAVAAVLVPFKLILSPRAMQHACRLALGCLFLLSVRFVGNALSSTSAAHRRSTRKTDVNMDKQPNSSGGATEVNLTLLRADTWFYLLLATQFHICFYATRSLPNTFALVCVNTSFGLYLMHSYCASLAVLGATATVVRCDLFIFILPYALLLVATQRVDFFKGLATGILACSVALIVSMPLDSYLWRKVLWAEGSVLFFNTVLNKSHEWGTLPIHSYFTSILPRAFIVLYPVVLFASFAVRRLRVTSVACLLFISLYSLLPHKELRFVLPVFPMMLAPVASLFAEHVTSYRRLMPCLLILLLHGYVALTFAWASSHNYPGADALRIVHEVALGSRRPGEACPATVSIFIDDFAAMTGISRFTQLRTAHTAGCFDADPASFVYEKNPAFFNSSCANCDYGNPARPFDFVIARASDQAWHANHSVYHVIRAVRQLSQVSWRQVPPRLDFSDYLLVLQKSHR